MDPVPPESEQQASPAGRDALRTTCETLPHSTEDEKADRQPLSLDVARLVLQADIRARPLGTMGLYELVEEIDRGGMGVVYLARHRVVRNKYVALKTMTDRSAARPTMAQRFEREVRATAKLQHAHIVPIEIGEERGRLFYVMPFASSNLARERERFREPQSAVPLMAKIAQAVQHAHENQVLHRDLKPSNVLLDAGDKPLVCDFGLAKNLDETEDLTRTGQAIGTVPYMAPEVCRGRKATAATDIWAMGVMLHELLAGRRPFSGPDDDAVIHQILTAEPPPLSTIRPELDNRLDTIVRNCLAKDVRHRYRSARLLAEDLRRWTEGQAPAETQTKTWAKSCAATVRGHPVWAALAVLLAAAVIWLFASGQLIPGSGNGKADQEKKAAESPVNLIGMSGPPREFQLIAGAEDAPIQDAGADEPFSLRTDHLAIVELRPSPPWPRFRFQTDVRHEAAKGDARVGIYFARRQFPTDGGDYNVLARFGFADYGSEARKGDLHLWAISQRNPEWPVSKGCGADLVFDPPPQGQNRSMWRTLIVEVDEGQVRVCWRPDAFNDVERCVGEMTVDELRSSERQAAGFRSLPANRPAFDPGGGIGVFVYHGAASFRNAVATPLPARTE